MTAKRGSGTSGQPQNGRNDSRQSGTGLIRMPNPTNRKQSKSNSSTFGTSALSAFRRIRRRID